MKTPVDFPKGTITSNVPGTEGTTPDDVNPNTGKPFKPTIPKDNSEPTPTITIPLGTTPVLTTKINIPTSSNVKRVTVLVPTEEVEETSPTTPGNTDELFTPILVSKSPESNGDILLPKSLKVTKIIIRIEAPKEGPNGTLPTVYEILINVHACLERKFTFYKCHFSLVL